MSYQNYFYWQIFLFIHLDFYYLTMLYHLKFFILIDYSPPLNLELFSSAQSPAVLQQPDQT